MLAIQATRCIGLAVPPGSPANRRLQSLQYRTWGNGTQISFACSSQEHVEAAWAAAIAMGGTDEGVPGLRPHYSEDYFGAYCRDPEGNKLCFVHAEGLE